MSTGPVTIRRALLSVADKSGLVELGQALAAREVQLISTGGTARVLREAGLSVTDVSEVTGHPEVFSGRVKTLHPKVHGGILARLPQDQAEMEQVQIEALDLVVVNLYRFEDAAAKGVELGELVEQIDIGGPAMLRAAAKSFARVGLLSDPSQYPGFLSEFTQEGTISRGTRERLAVAGFQRSAAYDAAVHAELAQRLAPAGEAASAAPSELPTRLAISGLRVGDPLRYGENPHQQGALYAVGSGGLGDLELHEGGKALSYNNLLDLDAAWDLTQRIPSPGACVIKHAGPCGAATGSDAVAAFEAAWEGDPLSAFGSVVGCNVRVDLALAEALVKKGFVEVIVAPGFEPAALERIRGRKGWGKSVRLVTARPAAPGLRLRSVAGGLLAQTEDRAEPAKWEVVTQRAPSASEEAALRFAWTCVRSVRSNAIVFAGSEGETHSLIGVGGGLPSRVDAVRLAARKASGRAQGAVMASDAFFPFPDGVEVAAEAGVRAVVQPGGSKKDADVIARADELGLAMVLTGTRHFRH
ncbi:MAG TPA: bifunctional phosphoribosylaminoimidazolecarboxamide formyltransferase/IMP cyclohydrolase PurH [Planctomycetes bacterium]|nr:bifunctional phosphoribosylaminoimidazolecarboxamide formyltransferase/IMP cyclohydrolase PurH [Planctomycetota bacterium]